MKKIDYKRLEWALSHYEKIEILLSSAYHSMDNSPDEFVTRGPFRQSTKKEVLAMFRGAAHEKVWLEAKLRAYKDLI